MTKGEYPYPPDEFDDVDPSTGPRGVHRRPRSRWATVWPYLAALVVSAVVAYVVIGFLWDERQAAPGAQVTESSAAADPGTATAAPTEPAATPTPTPEPTVTPPAAEPTPTEPPDLSTPVLVLNATTVPGLATATAGELEEAGWSDVSTGNFAGAALPGSTVRYADADLEASARAVAEALGIDSVELDPDATDGIEVVLEADFAG